MTVLECKICGGSVQVTGDGDCVCACCGSMVLNPKTDARQVTIDNLITRCKQFLEDGNFEEAISYSNRVLDLDPENAQAYFYRFCAEIKNADPDSLDCDYDYESNKTFNRARKNAKGELKEFLEEVVRQSKEYRVYEKAVAYMNEGDYQNAISLFESILSFHDSAEQYKICKEKLEIITHHDRVIREFEADMRAEGDGIRQLITEKYPEQWDEFKALQDSHKKDTEGMLRFNGWLYMIITLLCSGFFLWWGMTELSGNEWLISMIDLIGSEHVTVLILVAVIEFLLLYVFRGYKILELIYDYFDIMPSVVAAIVSFIGLVYLIRFVEYTAGHYVILGFGLICVVLVLWQLWWCMADARYGRKLKEFRNYSDTVMEPLLIDTVKSILEKYKGMMDEEELIANMMELFESFSGKEYLPYETDYILHQSCKLVGLEFKKS